MDDPLGFLRTAELGTVLAIAAGWTLVWGRFFPPLRTPAAPKGIVSLELAWTPRCAGAIIDSWVGRRLEKAAKRSVWPLDFVFIVFYGAALAALGVLAGRASAASGLLSGEHGDTLGATLAIVAVVAAVSDAVENAGLLAMLSGHLQQPVPAATSAVSSLKWLLIVLGLAGSLASLIASLVAAAL